MIARLLDLQRLHNQAWERAHQADDWDETERILVRIRIVSARLAYLVS